MSAIFSAEANALKQAARTRTKTNLRGNCTIGNGFVADRKAPTLQTLVKRSRSVKDAGRCLPALFHPGEYENRRACSSWADTGQELPYDCRRARHERWAT